MRGIIRFLLALTVCLVAVAPLPQYARGGGHGGGHHYGYSSGDVYVHGYTRKDGTYVAPHMRSAPDGIKNNNWSTKGNVNPYTGKPGTKAPDPSEPSPQSFRQDAATAGSPNQVSSAPTNARPVISPASSPSPRRYSLPTDGSRRHAWRAVHHDAQSGQVLTTLGTPKSKETTATGYEDWLYDDGIVRMHHGTVVAWSPRE